MTEPQQDFEQLLEHLSSTRGFDFTAYKRTTLMRRTQVRMQALGLESYRDYLDYLEVDPEEFGRFFDTILINVTSFFRDQPAWDKIARDVIPAILEAKSSDGPIRVWAAACASGEEAYTLAILFAEALGMENATARVKIFATDIDEGALRTARAATYTLKQLSVMPVELRDKYFETTDSGCICRRDLRRTVIFGRHDLLRDAPISRIDLLTCRNALMYFNSESQTRILGRLLFAVRESGYLMLGKAETLLSRANDVAPLDLKLRIFTKKSQAELRSRLLYQVGNAGISGSPTIPPPSSRIRESTFEFDPVAQVVVDVERNVVLANEMARRMFNVRERDLNQPLQNLELSYRPIDLRSLMDDAMSDLRTVGVRETNWITADGTARWIDTQAIPMVDDGGLIGVKFVFSDITNFKLLQLDLEASHAEIETAYEEIQSANEELETTNEELHSTVEELETTNEELQSANEELETTNEELHLTNIELGHANETLRQRASELQIMNAYMNAITSSLGTAAVVLDRDMVVQVWDAQAEEQWGLRAEEVVGQSFLTLDVGLPIEELIIPVRRTISGVDVDPFDVSATNRRGRAVVCSIAIRCLSERQHGVSGAILLITVRRADGESEHE